MTSLRQRLTIYLWVALLGVGVACAAFIFLLAHREADALLDYQMEQIAQFLGAQSFTASTPAAITPHLDIDHDDEDDFVVTVRDASGAVRYASRPGSPLPQPEWRGFRTLPLDGVRYRMFAAESGGLCIIVAQQTETRREAAAAAAAAALLPVGLMLPLLGLIIGMVIRRQFRPLQSTAESLAQRPPLALTALPSEGLPDEVRPLILEINRLLARQRAAVDREQVFLVDAAHALRTPLTALQLQADVLDESSDSADNVARRAELRAGIRRVVRLAEQLIAMARNETGGPVAGRTRLDEAAAESREVYLPSAGARGIRIGLEADSGATVPGTAPHFALLIGNLLDNACRHTPAGGCVRVSTRIDGLGATLAVEDEGPGLPEVELTRAFERFYRAPGDTTEGSGLGLAVVRNVAERLGGRVWLENRAQRNGLIARVWLPRL